MWRVPSRNNREARDLIREIQGAIASSLRATKSAGDEEAPDTSHYVGPIRTSKKVIVIDKKRLDLQPSLIVPEDTLALCLATLPDIKHIDSNKVVLIDYLIFL
jgi:hypothetical protein